MEISENIKLLNRHFYELTDDPEIGDVRERTGESDSAEFRAANNQKVIGAATEFCKNHRRVFAMLLFWEFLKWTCIFDEINHF